jgi:molybdopterin molybdotransferase
MPEEGKMLTPEQAQDIVLQHIRPLGHERVALLETLGRVLAEDILARSDNPPLDNSAMDGYALRHADIANLAPGASVTLEMIEDIPAGQIGQKTVGPGQTSRIMTGAPVPAGADSVIPVEDTGGHGEHIEIIEGDEKGANIRQRGEDFQRGDLLIKAGSECGAGEISIMASQQRSFPAVYRKPSVAILSTGDELAEIDQLVEKGHIVTSNTYGLAALALANGAVPRMLPIAPDDESAIRQAVESALEADFILSSGGVSVGEYDFIKKVLDDMGAEPKLWRVAMKPGKPLFFSLLQGKPYFGLPGNPISSLMSFLQFVRPAVRKAAGHPQDRLLLPQARAVLDQMLENDGDRRQYMRARLRRQEGRLHAAVQASQGSHILTSMLGANGIVVLAPYERVEAGQQAQVQLIGPVA